MAETAPPGLTLVLGGVRSGKSAVAERLVTATALHRVYIATAEPFDEGMRARIAAHRAHRDHSWRTVEAPLELAPAIREWSRADRVVLVDCLTLWLTNLMLAGREIEAAVDELADEAGSWPGPVVCVSNEVGLGGIAADPMARAFADGAGALHQRLAAVAREVVLVAAGLPLWLKR